MTEFFLTVVNMSISASWIVLAVLLLRLLLKRAPKWIIVLLWGIVAIRLICPFSIESSLSLIPSAETINPEIALNPVGIDSGVANIDNAVNPIIGNATISFQPEKDQNFFKFVMPYLAGMWLVGIAVLLAYTAISYMRLRKKVCTAVLLQDNIFQSKNVATPFVLGIFKPRIYLPVHMNALDISHVIAHEQAHIRRKDHLWKPFGFLLLSLHWFNPFMWLGYVLLCRDIELACDEKVIKELDTKQKADYSQALLNCSVNRRAIAACPLAFGEVSVKSRIISVLNYKKPTFWIIAVAIVTSLVVAVCFLTNPTTSTDLSAGMSAFIEEQILEHHRSMYKSGEFSCADFQVLGKANKKNPITVYMWVLYQEYTTNNGIIENISGAHIPTVITFWDYDGQYELVEYWEPRDGAYYAEDIRNNFPLRLYAKAIDSQRYIKKQQSACDQKAAEYFSSVSDFGGLDEPKNEVITANSENLREKFPMYFNLPTAKGLEVYIWQMGEGLYSCGLLPDKTPEYTQAELWELHKSAASLEEMQAIVNSYLADGEVTKTDVSIIPIIMPHSSYSYNIDEQYQQHLYVLFWNGIPFSESFKEVIPDSTQTVTYEPPITAPIPETNNDTTQPEEPDNDATQPEETTPPPQNIPEDTNDSNYKLIVSGRDITRGNYLSINNITDNSCDIHLPFTSVAKCYGVQVKWTSNSVAEVTFQDRKYILDLSDISLVKEGSSFNCIIPAPGSSVHSQVMGKELILDSVTLRSVLSFMGLNVQIRINHQDKTVTIQ